MRERRGGEAEGAEGAGEGGVNEGQMTNDVACFSLREYDE